MSTPGELLEALGREARARFGAGGTTPMRVFRGRSVDELVPQIQRELGADAIIVRRREGLTGGVLGFFQRAYVEIEAMPGAPGVDVYDEEDSPPPAPPPPPAAEAPAVVAPAVAPSDPGAVTQAFGPLDGQPYSPPPARAATPQPVLPQPQLDVEPLAPGPPVAPPPATPFYARDGTLAGAGGGSAYVTAHLAALARADRSKPPPRTAPATLVPTADPAAWRAEFQELSARNAPELFPRASAPARAPRERAREEPSSIERPAEESVPVERAPLERPAPRWAPRERREVAPGSQSRARAGVARSLERCGIGEALTEELIDGASAHALALAPRAGLAQAVRATLAQRIPVAPALPTKGAAIVVVGAGGAGKTTCCAALLGAYRKSSTLPASFATVTREPERGELEARPQPLSDETIAGARAACVARPAQGPRRRHRRARHAQRLAVGPWRHSRAREAAGGVAAGADRDRAAGDARRDRRRTAAAGAATVGGERNGGDPRR